MNENLIKIKSAVRITDKEVFINKKRLPINALSEEISKVAILKL